MGNEDVWKAVNDLGLPVVLSVLLVVSMVSLLIWLVKKTYEINEKERQRAQDNLGAERDRNLQILEKERHEHQAFISQTIKGVTDALSNLAGQMQTTTTVQYKLIDSMTQYTERIENSYERLEKGNRSQYEEHVKFLEAQKKVNEVLDTLQKDVVMTRKELAYRTRQKQEES